MSKQSAIYSRGRTYYVAGVGILFEHGTTVPTDGVTDYAPGCIFQKTDGSADACLYINNGTLAECNFEVLIEDGAIVSDRLAENLLQYVEVNITSTQIKAMSSTPILLIAAQGSGKIIELEKCSYHFAHSGSDYLVQNNWLGIKLGDSGCGTIDDGANISSLYRKDILERSTDAYGIMSGGSGLYEEVDGVYYDAADKGMYFVCETRNPTAGGGTLKFLITYRILDFS